MKRFGPFLLALLALGALASSVQAANILGVRSYRAPDYTRLVFDLDGPLQYELLKQDSSQQLVLNLKQSRYSGDFANLNLANTPVAGIGSTALNGSDLQITVDLRSKVDPRSFTLGKNEQYGDRLVVDLYDVIAAATVTESRTNNAAPAAAKADTSDPIAAISASLDKGGKRDIIVAISAGHGGDDPGAIGVHKLQEKQVTLAISREVASLLNNVPGYKAVLIREGDYYVPLRQRIEMGHAQNADLYIAIHADAADNKAAKGATVYALSERGATSEQARRLADKENNADLIGGVGSVSLGDKDAVLASVLLDLSMTASVATSLEIGNQMIASLGKVTHMRRDNVEQAAFVELKSADIPSLLVESGYITNADDAEKLDSAAWRKQFAGALVDGVLSWFAQRPPRGTLIAWQQDNGAVPSNPGTYTVRSGDGLSMIAERFHVSMADLKEANHLKKNSIQVGQVLKIPGSAPAAPSFKEHTIANGETLSQIATSYSVSLDSIRTTNQLKSDTIRPGQVLKIPAS